MMAFARWKERARALKREVHALALACADRRTPWYAKAVAAAVVAYALSPIDLIPDPIPILGHLDDLLLLPLGVLLVRALIPAEVLADCRRRAADAAAADKPRNWIAAGVIVTLWIATAMLLGWWIWRLAR
jgi:uncharacterized membrane protein YkvA (DUF1232 family)